ncbi:hypothetical protein SBA4_1550005 [Candidatus Sulfopaludibacter sp. SbA4]|nr:hypothetical protein SBA4_1550005 [Candidatus Sulfopaludibacter sp. SbA4]
MATASYDASTSGLMAEMCQKLRMANYTGAILMEVMMTHSRFQTPDEFLRQAQMAARRTSEAIRGVA